MSFFIIPLNDQEMPANNFMSEQLGINISQSELFQKHRRLIESHPLYIEFTKLPLEEQKKTFEGFMTSELSNKLDEELVGLSLNKRSKTVNRRSKTVNRRSKTVNRRSKSLNRRTMKNTLYPKFNKYTMPSRMGSVLAGGSALGSIMDNILFIIFILILIRPILFRTVQVSNLQKNIKNLSNISTNKNKYRLVFLIITNNSNYFLKIAPSNKIYYKQYAQQIDIRNLSSRFTDEYVYECLIYEEMNKPTNVLYNGRDLNTYVSEIEDWNIKKIDMNTNTFVVNLEGEEVDLNQVITTYLNQEQQLCNTITKNEWDYPGAQSDYYSYSIVKDYAEFSTFYDYIQNNSFTNLLDIFKNACNILTLFYQVNGFCHWDLHAQNILVNERTGEIKLFDFDLSEVYSSVSAIRSRLDYFYDSNIEVKNKFGHLYDFFRLIYENIYYYKYLRLELEKISNSFNQKYNPEKIIDYFYNNGILEKDNGLYTYNQLVYYKEICSNNKGDYINFFNTLNYFNEAK